LPGDDVTAVDVTWVALNDAVTFGHAHFSEEPDSCSRNKATAFLGLLLYFADRRGEGTVSQINNM